MNNKRRAFAITATFLFLVWCSVSLSGQSERRGSSQVNSSTEGTGANVPLRPILSSQFAHGTLATLQASGDYIVLAADSGVENAGQKCKIIVLGDQIVFASAGISARTKRPAWDTDEIARQQYAKLRENLQGDLIRNLAEGYGERLAEHLNRDLERSGSSELLSYITELNGVAGMAIFSGFSGKRRRTIAEVTVSIRVIGTRKVYSSVRFMSGDETVATDSIGDTTIAEEYEAGQTARSKGWRQAFEVRGRSLDLRDRLILKAQTIASLTVRYDPTYVSEPIDVVLLVRGHGVTWVQSKPMCDAARQKQSKID